jgi:enoyl-CoA hydratase
MARQAGLRSAGDDASRRSGTPTARTREPSWIGIDVDNILISQPAPGVTQLTLNRPERLNALTYDLVTELHDALDAVDRDHSCRAVVITGAGRGFCAGLDLNGFGTIPGTETFGRPQQGMAVQQYIARLVPHMRDVRQPIISAINGPCAGGGFAIALASDIRVCSESARFGTAFVRLGLSGCDIGVSWMLPRLIGASRAWELLLTGRVFDSAEADKLGLVTERVPDDQVVDTALAVAERIKANSPFGVWMTKEVMWSNLETGSLQAGIDMENRTQIMASMTEDTRRGMAGFLSRQPIEWENK